LLLLLLPPVALLLLLLLLLHPLLFGLRGGVRCKHRGSRHWLSINIPLGGD
jgi:hypothetical protein